MQNFWLKRRDNKKLSQRMAQVDQIVRAVINRKLQQMSKNGGKPWRQKQSKP